MPYHSNTGIFCFWQQNKVRFEPGQRNGGSHLIGPATFWCSLEHEGD
jgi:hypothetical protein